MKQDNIGIFDIIDLLFFIICVFLTIIIFFHSILFGIIMGIVTISFGISAYMDLSDI